MKKFSNLIKILRKQKNLTQKQIAEALNITERAYRGYEINQSTPNTENLIAIADFFDVSLDELVGREFPKNKT
jgi:transcriptional regulator with XRE-family HTH domain